MAQRFRFVGDHPEVLDGGQPVGFGDFVDLEEEQMEDPHTSTLIESGKLIEAEKGEVKLPAKSASRDIWAQYATVLDLSFDEDTTRDELIELVEKEVNS